MIPAARTTALALAADSPQAPRRPMWIVCRHRWMERRWMGRRSMGRPWMGLLACFAAGCATGCAEGCAEGGDRKPPPAGESETQVAFTCRCSFLTDMDDRAEVRIDYCPPPATPKEDVNSQAMGCAALGAPGNVQACACEPVTQTCPDGGCRIHER
ncbi:MAG: hypothetical protein AAGA56_30025 [Myxococcota bacterium]